MKIHPPTAEEKLGFDALRTRLAGYTRSRLGEERVERMQPARQLDWLREELGRVAELQEAFRFDDAVPLDHVLDLRDVLRRATPVGAYVSPEDLAAVRYASNTIRRLRSYFEQRKAKYPRLSTAVQYATPLPALEERIEGVVDEQTNGLKDNASPELRRLRRLLIQRQAQLRQTLQDALRKAIGAGHATEEQPTIRNGRMVIPVRAEAKRKVAGFVHDTSATGQTVYIEPTAVLDLNNEVRELEGEERREVERILREVTGMVRAHLDDLHGNSRVSAQFDLLQAKARLANELDAVVPHLNDEGLLEIKKGRNPLLLLHFQRQNAKEQDPEAGAIRSVVPLNLTLGGEFHTLIITGPNAGGKTVAMKTVGLFVLMLGYGLPVPCDQASSMCLFDHLFVDIGDEQSIEEDLSTFSSHIANLKRMLHQAGPESMVLIDEAGTGTDPDQGGALAQAVLERLTEAGARTLVTTHLGSLKAFAHEHPGVENGSMAFDQETLRPTYRFQAGVPGSSYAFEIADRIGLDPNVLARARDLLGEQKAGLEELVATFEARNQALAEQLAEAEATLQKATHERTEYETRIEKIRRERDEIRQQALEEAERIVQGANARIEQTIREIKEAQAEREATKAARAKLDTFKESVDLQQANIEKRQAKRKKERKRKKNKKGSANEVVATGPVRVGDQVVLDEGSTAAEVLEIDGNEAVITAGPLHMRVKLSRLTKVGGQRKQQVTIRQTASHASDLAVLHARTELDVRGQRVDEALGAVERLLDQALGANLDRVEILHGKGTGALRQAIHDYLGASPDVADFEDAAWNQGGAGVTVVKLR